MSPAIERLTSTASSRQLCEILERDGAVIVENILKPKQLANLNSEFDRFVSKVEAGLRNPTTEEMIEFYGHSTIRIDGLPAKSKTFLEINVTTSIV